VRQVAFGSPGVRGCLASPLRPFQRITGGSGDRRLARFGAHECTHWTRHETRLNREFGRKRWGDEGYAAEELVAELGSTFLCADLSLTPEPRADHASYIETWLRVLRNDKRAIFTAAAHAERAAAYLHGLQPKAETAAEHDADDYRAAA